MAPDKPVFQTLRRSRSSRPLSHVGTLTLLLLLPVYALFNSRYIPSFLASLFTVYLILVNISTFIVYGLDKNRSRIAGWRIRESTLHTCELAGGWPAAYIAQRFFRHKTRKLEYRYLFWAIVGIHQFWCVLLIW